MNMNQFLAIYKTRDKGTGSEMRETWGMEGECHILENVLKHSPECRQTFWGMSFLTFRVISPSIPGKWPQINFNYSFQYHMSRIYKNIGVYFSHRNITSISKTSAYCFG